MGFKKAKRESVRLRIAMAGPAGGGKTMSALKLARGIVGPEGKIALIDTENRSSNYYADKFEFDRDDIFPPYTTEVYIKKIKEAWAAQYDILIVDQISHAWAGEGGILDQKTKLDQNSKNSFASWGKMTPLQNKFIGTFLNSPIDVIVTMRSKVTYEQQTNDGRTEIKKLGLQPIQREGVDYELDVMFDINTSHHAVCSKDRTEIFGGAQGVPFMIEEEHGQRLAQWRSSGATEKVLTVEEKIKALPDDLLKVLAKYNTASNGAEVSNDGKRAFCATHGGDGRVWNGKAIEEALKKEAPHLFEGAENETNS